MSDDYDYQVSGADPARAIRKAERREQKRRREQEGPVAARYGTWTGQGYLREGESLVKKIAGQTLKVEGANRREKRRKRKAKK